MPNSSLKYWWRYGMGDGRRLWTKEVICSRSGWINANTSALRNSIMTFTGFLQILKHSNSSIYLEIRKEKTLPLSWSASAAIADGSAVATFWGSLTSINICRLAPTEMYTDQKWIYWWIFKKWTHPRNKYSHSETENGHSPKNCVTR